MESFSSEKLNISAAKSEPKLLDDHDPHHHVLLVDDNPFMRRYLETMFCACNCFVTKTESAIETLEFIYKRMENLKPKVSMICVNYNMSPQAGLNGYQVLVQIKGSPVEDVPVVIYCPDPTPAQLVELENCMSAGASKVIKKSLMLAEVVGLINQFSFPNL